MSIHRQDDIPTRVRAALDGFLDACQKEARPIASSQAVSAIRRMFPRLGMSDKGLHKAFVREASAAGFNVGEIKQQRSEGQRRRDNDTDGERRRALETQERNRLI